MRVISHPILGEEKETEWVTIYVNGKPIQAKKGEMILAALHAEGIIVNRYTAKKHEPRGIFCGIVSRRDVITYLCKQLGN